ncbi:MAG TPA: GNAT family N-acetyltransferase [Verrucomicrobiae bacterium]|nr:GNAT family N-acetyltransferase [Verrucomicrobiae bacterium]
MAQNHVQPGGISLRPERPEDEPLLAQIYASTREDELNLTNWDSPTRAAFLDMQFKAMLKGYRSQFAQAEFSIILSDGKPVGRMVVDRAPGEIRVVDIALLPVHCGHGIGTKLMRDIMDEAARAGKPVRLSVFRGTRATPFYLRLGFRIVSEPDIYEEMEWNPPR